MFSWKTKVYCLWHDCRWETTDSESGFSTRDSHVVRVDRKDRDSAAICRGWYQNILVPGMTILGTKTHNSKEGALHCAVTFNNRLHLIESFQVMTDRAGTSRLEWRHWDQFTKMPVGKEKCMFNCSYAQVILTFRSRTLCHWRKGGPSKWTLFKRTNSLTEKPHKDPQQSHHGYDK